ncbi:MAG: potassium transporter TrkH [Rhodospirillales bacterium CG15_BIG_FIL_POST_REV_8_21_14_020_66_15]|nr:MAG: potassium transporter TrkH [Rhodospirillales bacterium CG15_BIG_FIL_POST_REV_8_21_14_020_66_15]
MLNIRPIVHLMGLLACFVAVLLCVPAVTDAAYHNKDWEAFASAALIVGFIGVGAAIAAWPRHGIRLTLRQAFLVTTVGWITVSAIAAIPFLGLGISLTDAVFESMSGITTTGSTVLTGLDTLPPGILMWRAILQWLGGIGIIAMAILMLPLLRVGGMQLFKIESSAAGEKFSTSAFGMVVHLMVIYLILTVICAALYYYFGMSLFDAVTHSMTTLSTGGYSTHDASFGYFKNLSLHWVATIFMAAGAVPFYLYVKAVHGNFRHLVTDQQVRGFIALLATTSILMAFWLLIERGGDIGFFQALTLTSFNITSVVTTTGFASDDYTAWGPGAVGAFLALMFIGGCSGSTSGAIKIYRHQILYMVVRAHVKRLFSPNRMIKLTYNGAPLPDDVPYSILAFLAVFVATIAIFTVALAFLDLDILTAYSATVTAMTNVGPGLGPIVGPAGNFQPLPDAAKWILTFAMLAGRLEVLALLVAFDRDFWRD